MSIPAVDDALWGLDETEQLRVITKTFVDFEVVESNDDGPAIWIDGILQPMNSQDLVIKPEGQRTWQWWTLYTESMLDLDWVVVNPDGARLRVMGSKDWQGGGYRVYELAQGPTP